MSLVQTPWEYKHGIAPGNSITSGGFSEHFVIKRYQPTNGTDFGLGSRIYIKVSDTENIIHPNQMWLKYRLEARKGGAKYAGGNAQMAISGASSVFKTVTTSIGGKMVESIQNYNKFVAHEYINAPLEHKVYLAKTESVSHFVNGVAEDNRRGFFDRDTGAKEADGVTPIMERRNGVRYAMHALQTGLRGMSTLELPLIPTGIDFELLVTTDPSEIFPVTDGIDNVVISNVELVVIGTKPAEGFWVHQANSLQRGGVIHRPLQTVKYQAFQGNNSSSFTLQVDSGVAKSISSVLLLGNNANVTAGAGTTIDKLSFSDDMGIKTIRFNVGGRSIPEGKGISYNFTDPEAYVLNFRGRDVENMAFVPSMYLYDNARTIGNSAAKGWQFRFSLKDSLSAYGDGLSTLTGTFGITVSSVPEAPEFSTAPATFSNASSLDVFHVTDQVLEISAGGIRLTPVW